MKVALPVLELSALTVTVCAVAKLDGVNVRVPPPVTVSPLSPEVRVVVTVTFADGAADSDSPNVPVEPCFTDTAVGLATMLPVVPVTLPVQVAPLRVNVVGLVLVPL